MDFEVIIFYGEEYFQFFYEEVKRVIVVNKFVIVMEKEVIEMKVQFEKFYDFEFLWGRYKFDMDDL